MITQQDGGGAGSQLCSDVAHFGCERLHGHPEEGEGGAEGAAATAADLPGPYVGEEMEQEESHLFQPMSD